MKKNLSNPNWSHINTVQMTSLKNVAENAIESQNVEKDAGGNHIGGS